MDWQLPAEERLYLRDLARKQARYALLPVMARRKQMWYDLNDGRPGARPPVIIETWTFDRDFLPADVFHCRSETGRRIEGQMLRNVRNHELIDDDKVMPDYYSIGWFTQIDEMGVQIPTETVPDSMGVATGYQYRHPIKDLERDFGLLKPAVCAVDREKTYAWRQFLSELFDGSLEVRIDCGVMGSTNLTAKIVQLMGMEAYFVALCETPDLVHQLMAFLRDNCLRVMRWAEAEGLGRANNGGQTSFGSSYCFTHRLPSAGPDTPVRPAEQWGATNSQETVGISPAMYHEFCFPYYRDVVAPMGLLYYGCCEPPDPYWDDVSRYPHLKKVSVNRWTNQRFMGAVLRGTDIVFSRKPDPNLLGVHPKLDEQAWSAHIGQTLEATPDVLVEFIVRDVYTVHGNLSKPRRAVELAREQIDRHGRG